MVPAMRVPRHGDARAVMRMASAASASHVGYVRAHNEDAVHIDPGAGFLVVADGMGGHAAGEVASRIAVDTVAATLADGAASPVDALVGANRAVEMAARDGRGMPGMGCTLVAGRLVAGLLAVAWVGDSRAYLLRDNHLVRLSHDHSYVQALVDAGRLSASEAEIHPERNVLTRSIGTPSLGADAVDRVSVPVQPGDRVLLCTDGLTGELGEHRIESLLGDRVRDRDAVDALIEAALAAGGSDNVTVALATIDE